MKSKLQKTMTSGAYYRQLGQCRNKVRKIVYTLLLLRLFSVVDVEHLRAESVEQSVECDIE